MAEWWIEDLIKDGITLELEKIRKSKNRIVDLCLEMPNEMDNSSKEGCDKIDEGLDLVARSFAGSKKIKIESTTAKTI